MSAGAAMVKRAARARIDAAFAKVDPHGSGAMLDRRHLWCALSLCGVDTQAPRAQQFRWVHEAVYTAPLLDAFIDLAEFAALVHQLTEPSWRDEQEAELARKEVEGLRRVHEAAEATPTGAALVKANAAVRERLQARGFDAWVAHATESQRRTSLVQRGWHDLCAVCLSRAWATWLHELVRAGRRRHAMALVIGARRWRGVTLAWHRWLRIVCNRLAARQARRVTGRIVPARTVVMQDGTRRSAQAPRHWKAVDAR